MQHRSGLHCTVMHCTNKGTSLYKKSAGSTSFFQGVPKMGFELKTGRDRALNQRFLCSNCAQSFCKNARVSVYAGSEGLRGLHAFTWSVPSRTCTEQQGARTDSTMCTKHMVTDTCTGDFFHTRTVHADPPQRVHCTASTRTMEYYMIDTSFRHVVRVCERYPSHDTVAHVTMSPLRR